MFLAFLKLYPFRFTLVVVLGLCTQIKKTFNFAYFQNKNHISTNKKNKMDNIVNEFLH